MFPGMKFLEPTTEIEDNKSLQECQYSCTKELGCNSFSFSEPLNQCARSGQAIGYSEEWEYYEKDLSGPSLDTFKEKHQKENKVKASAKADYMYQIDKVRRKAADDKKKEGEEKHDSEVQVKTDQQNDRKAEAEENEAETKAERKAKTAGKTKQMAQEFSNQMAGVTKKIDQIETGVLERIEKKLVTEKDTTTIAELKVEKTTADKELETLKKSFDQEKVKEMGEKNALRKRDQEADQAEEKTSKKKQEADNAANKKKLDMEKARVIAKEVRSKNCDISLKEGQEKIDINSADEKKTKNSMVGTEDRVATYYKKAQTATKESSKKSYEEFHREAKEALAKTTADEQVYVAKVMSATRHLTQNKERCGKKEAAAKASKAKLELEKKEMVKKAEAKEASEKRGIKEGAMKVKEGETKEEGSKETIQKEGIQKAKIERTTKENKQKKDTLVEKTGKMERKVAETSEKHKAGKERIKKAQIASLQVTEKTEKTKEKEELEYNEKYKKESKTKELAEKDSQKMTIEVNAKEKKKAEEREEEASAKHAAREEAVIEAKSEKQQKTAMEKLSKTEEGKFKALMKRPRLSAVRRNDAGVIKVPVPSGTMLVGGGIINHYRKWNYASIFEESYPDGDQWRCDMGVGNSGSATCISLAYKMPEGTKCMNARAYTANAGVIHATLPPGYIMTSGGVQNLIRKFDRHAAFEQSMPSGDRKWRCDTGFGRGELNCFVRGCKFPHGAHCVTTEGSSNNAGWVWAECPDGYVVTGCGMRNNYLQFDPKSGFEDLRPVGNKCMGDMGFGPGRINVYARCCKVNGPPPKILAPPPPAAPGVANPDDVKCLNSARWEKKPNGDCMGGDMATVTLEGDVSTQVAACASKCQQKESCTGFTFPSKGSSSKKCKLKGSVDYIISEELKKKCDSFQATNDFDSYAKLSGPCLTKDVDTASMASSDRRRVQINRRKVL